MHACMHYRNQSNLTLKFYFLIISVISSTRIVIYLNPVFCFKFRCLCGCIPLHILWYLILFIYYIYINLSSSIWCLFYGDMYLPLVNYNGFAAVLSNSSDLLNFLFTCDFISTFTSYEIISCFS